MTKKKAKLTSRRFTPATRSLHEQVYSAISNAREDYVNTRNALSGTIEKCEEFVNSQRHKPDVLQVFIETKWLKRMPSGHLYIQLA